MIAETQGREPAVHDLAREVRYRSFDRPVLLAARERIYAAAEADLAAPGGRSPARRNGPRASAPSSTAPQPLHRVLSQRFAERRAPTCAKPCWRSWCGATTASASCGALQPRSTSTARSSPSPATSTAAPTSTSSPPTPAYERLAWQPRGGAPPRRPTRRPRAPEIVADLYFWRPGRAGRRGRRRRRDRRLLAGLAALPAGLRRVAVALFGPGGVRNFTFRRAGARRRLPRGAGLPRHPPHAGPAPAALAAAELPPGAPARSREGLLLPRRGAREPARRAPVRRRRGARPDAGARRRRAASSSCPSSSTC